MLSKALEAGAIKVAEEVLANYGFNSAPISSFAIAERADITVKPKKSDQPGVSGFLLRVENNFGIMYADYIKNEGFMNFTVAHELGHYFLPGHPERLFPHNNGMHCSRSGFQSNEEHEREADFFATALLMPRALFRRAMEQCDIGFDAIEKMAAEFATSITATAIRYAQFTPDPVAVVISSGGTIEYGFLSDCLREIRGCQRSLRGLKLSPITATAQFNKNVQRVLDCEREFSSGTLDQWIPSAPALQVQEEVVGLGSYRKTMTILFSENVVDADEYEDPETDEEDLRLPSERGYFPKRSRRR